MENRKITYEAPNISIVETDSDDIVLVSLEYIPFGDENLPAEVRW